MPFTQVYSGIHGRTLVFTQTKRDADELAVSPCFSQDARVLHGDIVQKQRETTLKVRYMYHRLYRYGNDMPIEPGSHKPF